MTKAARDFLKSHPVLLAPMVAIYGQRFRRFGCNVTLGPDAKYISIRKGDGEIRLSLFHNFYLEGVTECFDRFLDSIEPVTVDGIRVADFSNPKRHRVPGVDFDVLFTSLPEESSANTTYLQNFNFTPGDVVIDAGAYCGVTAYLFSRAVGPRGLVIAVEADPQNYAAMLDNIKRSGVTNVRPVNAALWSERGKIQFEAFGILSSKALRPGRKSEQLVEVDALTLMDLCLDLGLKRVDHVKMDIEGGEYSVIPASTEFVRRFNPDFIIEAHLDVRKAPNVKMLAHFFEDHGYSMKRIEQPPPEPLPLLHFLPDPSGRSH